MNRLILGALCLWIAGNGCQSDPFRNGAIVYKNYCANCHMDDGSGLGELIPPLAGADYLREHRERLPCIVRYGLQDTITVNGVRYAEHMAGIKELNEIQITNVLNFIQDSWGNQGQTFSLDEVRALLKDCAR